MKTFRHIIRGCGNLKHCGEHPGTPILVGFTLIGAVAGANGGWFGALMGAAAMLAFNGPFYLWGAYDRSRLDEEIERKAGKS